MKYETIFLMIRVQVHADHTSLADIVREVEQESRLELSDTANVNILETEILVSRIHNSNVNRKRHEKIPFVPEPTELLKTEPFHLKNNDHGTQFEL